MSEFKELKIEDIKQKRSEEFHNNVCPKKLTKKHARFIAITRVGVACRRHDLAILTSDMEFYEFQLKFGQNVRHLSHLQYEKILGIFRCFTIDNQTEIVIQDTVHRLCPLMFYFKIIRPYAKYNLHTIGMPQVVGRLCSYNSYLGKTKTSTSQTWASRCIHTIWNKLVETRECPFITKGINDSFALMPPNEATHHKRIRVFMYYMLIRRILNKNKPKCANA